RPCRSGGAASRPPSVAPVLGEGRVERRGRWREVERAAERRRLGGAVDAVHAHVLPLDGERSLVADVVEGDDDLLEVDVAAAHAAEVPVAARVAECLLAAEYPGLAVPAAPPDVLLVHVADAVREAPDEPHVVHALVGEVRALVVEPERGVAAPRLARPLRRGDV